MCFLTCEPLQSNHSTNSSQWFLWQIHQSPNYKFNNPPSFCFSICFYLWDLCSLYDKNNAFTQICEIDTLASCNRGCQMEHKWVGKMFNWLWGRFEKAACQVSPLCWACPSPASCCKWQWMPSCHNGTIFASLTLPFFYHFSNYLLTCLKVIKVVYGLATIQPGSSVKMHLCRLKLRAHFCGSLHGKRPVTWQHVVVPGCITRKDGCQSGQLFWSVYSP